MLLFDGNLLRVNCLVDAHSLHRKTEKESSMQTALLLLLERCRNDELKPIVSVLFRSKSLTYKTALSKQCMTGSSV